MTEAFASASLIPLFYAVSRSAVAAAKLKRPRSKVEPSSIPKGRYFDVSSDTGTESRPLSRSSEARVLLSTSQILRTNISVDHAGDTVY